MDGLKLQAKTYAGYAKSAKKAGLPYHHFRPSTTSNPLTVANQMPDIYALNERHMGKAKFDAPEIHGKPYFDSYIDGRLLQIGDYIQSKDGSETYFVASMQHIQRVLLVLCNAVISIGTQTTNSNVGATSYGGITRSNEVPLISGWPCSLLFGAGGGQSDTKLPSEPSSDEGVLIMVPPIPGGLALLTDQFVIDQHGTRFLVLAIEESSFGWRLRASRKGP